MRSSRAKTSTMTAGRRTCTNSTKSGGCRRSRISPGCSRRWGGSSLREEIETLAAEAQSLLPYREVGKHYLMMGYEEIRRALVEFDRRFRLCGNAFYPAAGGTGRFREGAGAAPRSGGEAEGSMEVGPEGWTCRT